MLTTATKSPTKAPIVKRPMEISALLCWAYREELPKRQISSAEGIWRDMDLGAGGMGGDHGCAQRYPHHGLPHDDALLIEDAVSDLPLMTIDWAESLDAIMGDLAGLITVNDLCREQAERGRVTQSSWPSKTYSKTQRRAQAVNKPRDVILVGSIDMGALVTSHARQGTRPRWHNEPVTCHKMPSKNNANLPAIIGECRGKDLYATGSCCPLRWGIPGDKWGDVLVSLLTIATARADYLAWWRGLAMLAESLVLGAHVALPPAPPQLPWFDAEPAVSLFGMLAPPKLATLPMKPQRETAGRTRGQAEDVKDGRGRRVVL
jgi:hypothetical protein